MSFLTITIGTSIFIRRVSLTSPAGIELDVWSNPSSSGLSHLPLTVLFILHGRGSSRSAVADKAIRILKEQSIHVDDWKRELVIVTFVGLA